MQGQENAPVNSVALAALLGIQEVPFSIVVGRPPKGKKTVRRKPFGKRVQTKK
jgi:hypothetical protein